MNKLDQLFYTTTVHGDELILKDQEAVHCSLVLRKKVGDIIRVVDGKGKLYKCGIDELGKREVRCTVLSYDEYERAEMLSIAIAPTKNRDRLEWLLEKLVEIGVKEIIIMQTERTERSKINMERVEKKLISAMKQSLRYYLPNIKLMSFQEVIDLTNKDKFIAHCIDGYQPENIGSMKEGDDRLVLIGPEGDFTIDEVQAALNKGFKTLGLGKFRLRTETAAIVAAAKAN